MRTSVSLNGTDMRELGRYVLVLGVNERAPQLASTTLDKGTGVGAWITGRKRSFIEVGVLFALRTRRDRVLRAQTLERVSAWAEGGGILRASHRPGRRLNVVCEALPEAGRIGEWTSEYEAVFRAYDVPYWEDEQLASLGKETADETLEVTRQGTAPTPLWFSARNTGTAAADTLAIACGSTRMDFAGLGMAVGETLVCDAYGGLPRVVILGTDGAVRDATGKRAITSDDELMLTGHREKISMKASQRMVWTLSHRGRYA